ncbi:pyrimidine/purine nucleoside phosphorylase [Entomomonas asaccharolytica]|uniref:Pyrimidine/purine nucleoside phosphorylase n=1 Tax=Entomomonas asaccharolytica TaxID=2785331 RepID=A0A974RW50_9GAMM|nr:pyrimidine/purine nucleoside phosphorylase [Entomomonas asaccharolytica]QQP84861.1 pyrimidine/purine nucleoside phosphorylase [Entomomonas asaccharolytica]
MIEINQYFDGAVKSMGFNTEAFPVSVGVMEKGEYEFATGKAEVMRVICGLLTIKLAGQQEWQSYATGTFFHVPANSKFQVKARMTTAYLCEYHE